MKNLAKKLYLPIAIFCLVSYGCANDQDNDRNSGISITSFSPIFPETLKFKEFVVINYDYEVFETEGVRIWVMPYTNGKLSPKYSYTSSPLMKGSGSREVATTITSGNITKVDQLKLKIASADGSSTLNETFVPVDYTFVSKID